MRKESNRLERVVLEKNDQIVTLIRAANGLKPDLDLSLLPVNVQKAVEKIQALYQSSIENAD